MLTECLSYTSQPLQMGFRNCLEAGWIGFEPLQDLEYVDLNIIAQVLEQSIKLPLPQLYRHGGIDEI